MDFKDLVSNIPWKEVITSLLSAVTAAVAIINWRAARFRSKLKDDFEILRRYRDEFGEGSSPGASLNADKRYICLREKIQKRMEKAYVKHGTDMSDVITASGFFLASLVTWLLTGGQSLWGIGVIVVLAGIGVAFLFAAFENKGKDRL